VVHPEWPGCGIDRRGSQVQRTDQEIQHEAEKDCQGQRAEVCPADEAKLSKKESPSTG